MPSSPRALDVPVLAAAGVDPEGVFACVNLHNFKAANVLIGHAAGDRILGEVQAALAASAHGCWRTGGDEFVALFRDEIGAAREAMRRFCWSFHRRFEALEAWRLECEEPTCDRVVVHAAVEAVLTPRCGLAPLGGDPASALEAARVACEAHAQAAFEAGHQALGTGPWAGFPRLARGLDRRALAERACPRCGSAQCTAQQQEWGRTRERCGRCGLSFWRVGGRIVDGQLHEGAYL